MKIIRYLTVFIFAFSATAAIIPVSSALDIQNAMSGLSPGDTMLMGNGIWTDQHISFHAEGTEQAPIVLRAETPGQVVLTGNSYLFFSGSYIIIDGLNFSEGYSTGNGVIEFRRSGIRANNCRLTNTTIFNYNPSSIGTNYKWVSMYGQNNQVDHCYFAGKSHDGATFVIWLSEEQDRDNHHIIEYNYFGYRPPLGFNGGETIRIGTSTWSMTNSRSIVRHNVFERCDGEIEIISNKSCENVYFNNTFIDNEGTLTLRHGNRCLVEGNFFFGEGNDEAGGVRIIGADHTIINNYFHGLQGNGYRSAITMVKGVEDSPLNRYFQVENSLIAYNTIIDCRQSILMGYGSSSDQTLPPINNTIANNAVYANSRPVFYTGDAEGLPLGTIFLQNIVIGSALGIPDTSDGIIWQDPQFDFFTEALARPAAGSPLIGQAAALDYDVDTDMDGQSRGVSRDIGADQVSNDPVLYTPLAAEDVGPDWFYIQSDNIYVEAGLNTLVEAAALILPGDTLFLSGSEFTLDESVLIDRDVIILTDPALNVIPVIRPAAAISRMFDIQGNGRLEISGVTIDGGGALGTRAQRIFHANYANQTQMYSLQITDVNFKNIGATGDYGTLLEVNPASMADSLVFIRCDFQDINGEVFALDVTEDESGLFSANQVLLEDCTFWNISKTVLSIYGGDTNPFSGGPVVMVNQCTFYYCGYDNVPVIDARNVDVATVQNCIFSQSSQFASLVELYSWSQIMYTNIDASGDITLYPNVTLGAGILYEDPQFSNPSEGQFDLLAASVLYDHPGNQGVAYGDRRRHDPSIIQAVDDQPIISHNLVSNYPNPFNGETILSISLENDSQVDVQVYDLTGRQLLHPISNRFTAGAHNLSLNLSAFESGVYLCKVSMGRDHSMTKMTVIK
ncbi:MAG: T9SS type A sorting domain-containing protein [Candidatus Marinimicrobia bacterium]|nr:T9SS type A sorting domain-containing protein [Candidatus Neomarinimicrobiota bacterium]